MPRPRPPFPAVKGLWEKPSIINNVETLACVPFILREKGSGTREVFERAMPHINAQWVCNNSEAILHGVEQGFGMTVISRRLAEQRLGRGGNSDGSLIELRVTDMSLERQFSVVWHKNKYKSNSLQQFIDISARYGLEQEQN